MLRNGSMKKDLGKIQQLPPRYQGKGKRGEKKRNYSSPRVPFARRSQVSHYLRDSIRLIKEALSKGVVEGVHEGGVGVVCVEDDDERISNLAKLFFSELSTKDNAIYNNLPDGMHFCSSYCLSLLTARTQSSATCLLALVPLTRRPSRRR